MDDKDPFENTMNMLIKEAAEKRARSNDLLSALQRVAKAAMFLTAPCCEAHEREGFKELNDALSAFTDDSFSELKR